jgi:mannose-6-phosphate isomerase-like protein (cupin superfamily)
MRRIILSVSICGIVVCLFLFLLTLAPVNAEDTTDQIISHIDEILKENPLPAGQKAQMIKIAEDNTITFFVLRATEGAEVKPHVHKTHDETVYVIKGTAQMFVNGKWVDLKPGSLHFNPMGKVHGIKHTGTEPLVAISIFTPAMKETDRHFVQ